MAWIRALIAAALLSAAGSAAAETCPVMPGADPALARVPAAARLRFLREQMQHAARRARAWAWGWGITHATLMTINLALIPVFDDPGQRVDFYFGASTSALGVALLVINPPRILRDQRRAEALVSSAAASCARLAEIEGLLVRSARDDARGKSALLQVGSMIFNLGLGATLTFAFGRQATALGYVLAGSAIGELMIVTRPDDTVRALAQYRSGRLAGPTPRTPALAWGLAPALSPNGCGVRLGLAF
jgi:hypothetical protein